MSEVTRDVTGGDLNDLWRAGNVALVTVANVYVDKIARLTELPDPDEKKYGRTHPWWAMVANELETALWETHDRLHGARDALNKAIDAYAYCDGDTAKALTEAGEGLDEILNDDSPTGKHDSNETPTVIVFDKDDFPRPDDDFRPDGWEENHG